MATSALIRGVSNMAQEGDVEDLRIIMICLNREEVPPHIIEECSSGTLFAFHAAEY
jgi:hypothetical protein